MNDRYDRPRRGLLDGMADIVTDLWGDEAPAANREQPAAQPAAAPAAPEKPALPPFSEMWKVADDAIDWTEALASPTPTDGLTAPDRWALYHRHAAAVLAGDVAAYLAVLKAADPLSDLAPYVAKLDVSTQSADLLRVTFAPRADLLAEGSRAYLSGMALRIARDLFAALPVSEVEVAATAEAALLTVSFGRSETNRIRFAFVDPVEFVLGCGGVFSDA